MGTKKEDGIFPLLSTIFLINLFSWAFAIYFLHGYPSLLWTALVAYSLGLRHAFDADHIAAIDNVTRKLRQDGKGSKSVGFFFSLGHSTVVILLSMVIIATFKKYSIQFEGFKNFGSLFGSVVSGTFLFLIGLINFFILFKLIKTYKKLKSSSSMDEKEVSTPTFLNVFFNKVYKFISSPKKMYFIGFLFGLGFDTATEIGVLGISALMAKTSAIPYYAILSFPLLFTSGMTLLDTLDGILMFKIYDWAINDAKRKITFNIIITGITIFTAILVGSMEWLEVILSKVNENLYIYKLLEKINFEMAGTGIIIIMILTFLVAFLHYKKILFRSQNEK